MYQDGRKRMNVGFLASTVGFVLPVRPCVSMESRSSAMPGLWDNAFQVVGKDPSEYSLP